MASQSMIIGVEGSHELTVVRASLDLESTVTVIDEQFARNIGLRLINPTRVRPRVRAPSWQPAYSTFVRLVLESGSARIFHLFTAPNLPERLILGRDVWLISQLELATIIAEY